MIEQLITLNELAIALNVNESTIKRYNAQGMPKQLIDGKNMYNKNEVDTWMSTTKKSGKVGRPQTPVGADLQTWRLRKEKAAALRLERENAVADSKLIDAALEKEKNIRKITAARNHLCGIGARIATQLVGMDAAEIQFMIDIEIENALKNLSEGK